MVEDEKTPLETQEERYNKLKEVNDKIQDELLRGEELRAKAELGGQSEAGKETVEEETKASKAAEFFKGTTVADTIKKYEKEII